MICPFYLDRTIQGVGSVQDYTAPQETFKANQVTYLYVEECDISTAWDNAFDCVGCQYGQILRNKIHNAMDWCIYTKGMWRIH